MKLMGFLLLWSFYSWGIGKKLEAVMPQREISIIVTKEGYYPKNLVAFKGEKVKFYVTSTTEDPDCFIIQGHKVFLAAQKGKITETDIVMEHSGEFSFYCPSSKNSGKLTILNKKNDGRNIASEGPWMPKDHE
jgi:hypothetical protein